MMRFNSAETCGFRVEAGGDDPIGERGFFEVADAVGVEGDPVVTEEHLAGDLGVDGVGVVEQGRSDEGETGVEEKPEGDEDEAVAFDRGLEGEGGLHCGVGRGYQQSLR